MDIPPSTRTRLISAMASRPVPAGSVMLSPSADATPRRGHPGWCPRAGHGPGRFGAFDLKRELSPRQQLGDRTLPDDAAAVHDGDSVHRSAQPRRGGGKKHDRAALGHHREDHVTHLGHSGRVEPVHRFVQQEQPGRPAGTAAPPGAGASPASTPRPGRRPGGPGRRAQARPMRPAPPRVPRPEAAGSACREMAVEPGFVDDGADTSERRVAMPRDRVSEQGHRASIGAGQSQQHPDERGLAARRWGRGSRRSPGEPGARHRSRQSSPRNAW